MTNRTPLPCSTCGASRDGQRSRSGYCTSCTRTRMLRYRAGICAGCGDPIQLTWTSASEAMCRACRRQNPKRQRSQSYANAQPVDCAICGTLFQPKQPHQKYCSAGCRKRRPRPAGGPRRGPARNCEVCGISYRPSWAPQRTCSLQCGVELRAGNRTDQRQHWPMCKVYFVECAECGQLFTAQRSTRILCSKACGYQRNKQQIIDRYHTDPTHRDNVLARSHARRADKLGLGGAKVTLTYLCERDGWRCGICRKPVKAKSGPMRPSIDHIIPLSIGGTHELANVQLAHYRCNLSKNASGVGDQLILFG